VFKIAIVGGPAKGYVTRCLNSLVLQSELDWQACVVLDPVGDGTYEEACSINDPRITVIQNECQRYALWNTCTAIDMMTPCDEDIIASIDADDWLTGLESLKRVADEYQAHPWLALTYGSWVSYPNRNAPTNTTRGYTEDEFRGNIRKVSWRASHLKTFKYKLWRRIDRKDFEDPRGGYFRVSWDLAFMWPMLEMAGANRCRYIPDPIYTYNQATPFNDAKLRLEEQMHFTDYIAAMPPYKYVEDL